MRIEGLRPSERRLPSWIAVGSRVRVVGNSNEHNYAIGDQVEVVELEPRRGAFRARRSDGEVGNWLVTTDVQRVEALGWEWLAALLPPADVELLSAFDGLETLALKEEVKAEIIKQVPDLRAAILRAAREGRGGGSG